MTMPRNDEFVAADVDDDADEESEEEEEVVRACRADDALIWLHSPHRSQ